MKEYEEDSASLSQGGGIAALTEAGAPQTQQTKLKQKEKQESARGMAMAMDTDEGATSGPVGMGGASNRGTGSDERLVYWDFRRVYLRQPRMQRYEYDDDYD